jgi:hypothetical protein
MTGGKRKAGRLRVRDALSVAPAILLIASMVAGTAAASTGPYSRIQSICLRERAVLRPEAKAEAADVEADAPKRLRMVRVSYCDLQRQGCFVGEVEVSMSICRKVG